MKFKKTGKRDDENFMESGRVEAEKTTDKYRSVMPLAFCQDLCSNLIASDFCTCGDSTLFSEGKAFNQHKQLLSLASPGACVFLTNYTYYQITGSTSNSAGSFFSK